MAVIKRIPAPYIPPPSRYVLELSEDEIMILRAALGRGCATLTTAMHDAIYDATKEVDQRFRAHISDAGQLQVERV